MTAASIALSAMLAVGAQWATAPGQAAEPRDLRSWEVLDFDCESDLGRHRMTLFANGTVRLKIREGEDERMILRELGPEELTGYLNRLGEADLSESESSSGSAAGEWVESCELTLDLEESEEQRFRLGRYDSVSLGLSHVVGIAGEITAWAEEEVVATDFPKDYEPRSGDVLKRRDGILFEVIALTSDKRGVELRGIDQPLVIYVLREEVRGEFVAVVKRRRLP